MNAPDQIRIRLATVDDAGGIARVHVQTWRTTYGSIVPQMFLDAMSVEKRSAFWERVIRGETPDGHWVLIAEEAGEVIGFASAGRERQGDGEFAGEIGGLYVLADRQRRGVGRRLMTEAAQRLLRENVASMLVWVLRDSPSCAFYERMGGVCVREKGIEIGGAKLIEVAYGWRDLAVVFGKPPRRVIVVPYDPAWPDAFEAIRRHVAAALGELAARIEHVGSTSVPGLAAKPIIDLDVLLRDGATLEQAIARLGAIGYEHEGDRGIPGRHAFRTSAAGPAHHLYVCLSGCEEFGRHVALRDFLREHADHAAAYGELKLKLAAEFRADIDAYMAGKDATVRRLLEMAVALKENVPRHAWDV